ncbi:aldose 1-epimerase [Metallosphaera tengchongensis]|uniref:Aldose 1-epimerase n=1 Tax=Metallosphaera tengchongensis TaxID=1532350 RepID=A0A6N0NVI4_9CREN|nr:aldose 1-epimerase [Metallosphaera tengchongensis]QKQ99150.1 aldose 1-epimerase [Metallosphaera tengchongensis]
MNFYKLVYDRAEAIISDRGAYLFSFRLDGLDVILRGTERPTRGGMALLVPFANRVKNGRYLWKGKAYQLPLGRDGNAIHGLILYKEFQVTRLTPNSIELETEIRDPGYPSILALIVKYTLTDSISVDMKIRNVGEEEAPLIVGSHPYFLVQGSWKISPNAGKRLIMKENIPTGEMEDFIISEGKYDDCFYLPGDVTLSSKYSEVRISKPGMDYVQLYTGVEGAVAVEPMSGAPDGYNNGIGLRVLGASESESYHFSIQSVQVRSQIS